MNITIKRPTEEFEIVTDLDALRHALDAAASIPDADTDGMTETEIADKRRERDEARSSAKELQDKADESTLVLTLQGLTSSAWNLIVLKNTDPNNGQVVKNWAGIAKDSMPRMVQGAHWKGQTDEVAVDDLDVLLDSLADSQLADLIQVIQSLNVPRATVPKELREIVSRND